MPDDRLSAVADIEGGENIKYLLFGFGLQNKSPRGQRDQRQLCPTDTDCARDDGRMVARRRRRRRAQWVSTPLGRRGLSPKTWSPTRTDRSG